MAPKKNCKQAQEAMVEELTEDRVVPPKSIGEEEPMAREDQDEPKSEEEQRSSVLFTPEQLEALLKMNRPDFGELVAAQVYYKCYKSFCNIVPFIEICGSPAYLKRFV
jgi:hypothetical protein